MIFKIPYAFMFVSPAIPKWIAIGLLTAILLYLVARVAIGRVRKLEQLKAARDKELFMLQAKALNAQMSPHFIFNCLNSIKSLVQMNENSRAVEYLNLFSKLTRGLMQHGERFVISLFEELEICQWYVQLEKLRFGNKVQVEFSLDEEVDTSNISVPVLLIQPFIENAVWHGLVPRHQEGGILKVKLLRQAKDLLCTIEDNGIGRAAAMRMNNTPNKHKSKGMSLSQERVNLYNKQQGHKISILINDKFDEQGEPNGTCVSIIFYNYLYD